MTCSSGNHGVALSYISGVLGYPCTVVVPRECPPIKKEQIQANGAKCQVCHTFEFEEKLEAVARIANQEGKKYISSANHLDVIAGTSE